MAKTDAPYVLGLDGGYGTGKTHFSTRFSVLLDKTITTIYFSVWEQDYMVDPFVVFAEKIIWIARQNGQNEELLTKILTSVTSATKVRVEFGLWGLFKIQAELSGKELMDKLFPEKQRSDLFFEIKMLLAEFIKELPKKKLVLVVDELDRCRPDYAVKVLETIISEIKLNSYSYQEMYGTIDNVLSQLVKIDVDSYIKPAGYYNPVTKVMLHEKIEKIKAYLNQQRRELLNFQNKTGSDDNDGKRLAEYNKIQNPTSIL